MPAEHGGRADHEETGPEVQAGEYLQLTPSLPILHPSVRPPQPDTSHHLGRVLVVLEVLVPLTEWMLGFVLHHPETPQTLGTVNTEMQGHEELIAGNGGGGEGYDV